MLLPGGPPPPVEVVSAILVPASKADLVAHYNNRQDSPYNSATERSGSQGWVFFLSNTAVPEPYTVRACVCVHVGACGCMARICGLPG
jgi:hypothetical protein